MDISNSVVIYTAETFYNLLPCEKELRQLHGYSDRNFAIVDSSDKTKKYFLKIVDEEDSNEQLTSIIDEILINGVEYFDDSSKDSIIRMPRLIRTASDKPSVTCNIHTNEDENKFCNIKLFQYVDNAKTIYDAMQDWPEKFSDKRIWIIFEHLGKICYQLTRFLRTQQHLRDQLKNARGTFPWQVITCKETIIQLRDQFFPSRETSTDLSLHKRQLVDNVLLEWDEKLQSSLERLPEFVLHGDLNVKNILMHEEQDLIESTKPYYVIDFQDVQVGPRVLDLAIMMLYAILETFTIQQQAYAIETIPAIILRGYQSSGRDLLCEQELILLPGLMRFRLCQSMLNGLQAFELDPRNPDVLTSNLAGWDLLDLLFEKDAQLNESLAKQQQQRSSSSSSS